MRTTLKARRVGSEGDVGAFEVQPWAQQPRRLPGNLGPFLFRKCVSKVCL